MPPPTDHHTLGSQAGEQSTAAKASHEPSEAVTPSPAPMERPGENTEFTAASRSSAPRAGLQWPRQVGCRMLCCASHWLWAAGSCVLKQLWEALAGQGDIREQKLLVNSAAHRATEW